MMRRFSFLAFLFAFALFLAGGASAFAEAGAESAPAITGWSFHWTAGVLMLILLFTAFYAMTRYNVPLPLAMSLVSCSFLIIQWDAAEGILRQGFLHYANIT